MSGFLDIKIKIKKSWYDKKTTNLNYNFNLCNFVYENQQMNRDKTRRRTNYERQNLLHSKYVKPNRIGQEVIPKDSDSSSRWNRGISGLVVLLLVGLALAALFFTLSLSEWVRDGNARNVVNMAQTMLRVVTICILGSERIADEATMQKAQTTTLQATIDVLKTENAKQTMEIADIGVNNTVDLVPQINDTILNQQAQITTNVDALNETLQTIASMGNGNNVYETLIESGTCELAGQESLTFALYSQTLSPITFYYYVFGTTNFVTINDATTSILITNCNLPILGGIPSVDITATSLLDRFESTPVENWVGGITSDGNALRIHRNANITVGTQLRIQSPLTYLLDFF